MLALAWLELEMSNQKKQLVINAQLPLPIDAYLKFTELLEVLEASLPFPKLDHIEKSYSNLSLLMKGRVSHCWLEMSFMSMP